ncbi:Hpt domain-containing protein [uncultured Paraglaciecola sp.]|uniref:Hpt domain-containing protein n=1 Tax=uncultured Paraglaciecola sp. TaxID=1765024 RepID=UPI002637E172|nr:Hpt domain-containing protein [uncultured Paraglaciecola sp.]
MLGSELRIFDSQFAINQFSGNRSILVNILEKFILQYQDFESLMAQHVQQSDIETVKRQVHDLKGVSSNLGLIALNQACKDLEVDLTCQITNDTLDNFSLILRQTLGLLRDYSSENS